MLLASLLFLTFSFSPAIYLSIYYVIIIIMCAFCFCYEKWINLVKTIFLFGCKIYF